MRMKVQDLIRLAHEAMNITVCLSEVAPIVFILPSTINKYILGNHLKGAEKVYDRRTILKNNDRNYQI